MYCIVANIGGLAKFAGYTLHMLYGWKQNLVGINLVIFKNLFDGMLISNSKNIRN